jgi:hypothetical protein
MNGRGGYLSHPLSLRELGTFTTFTRHGRYQGFLGQTLQALPVWKDTLGQTE